MRILVVEDDLAMADLLRRALAREGYAVDAVETGEDGLWSASENAYDAVVLDVMIPPPDGIALVRELRRRDRELPVLMLSARDDVADRVAGLSAGADDYLPKPFALAELFARVRALTRRESVRVARITVGDLVMDEETHQVWRGEAAIDLTPREFGLLRELMRHPGQVVSRSHLIREGWDRIDRPFGTHTLETVRGAGFRLLTSGAPVHLRQS
jgi:two-component system, OmpR family, response regulator